VGECKTPGKACLGPKRTIFRQTNQNTPPEHAGDLGRNNKLRIKDSKGVVKTSREKGKEKSVIRKGKELTDYIGKGKKMGAETLGCRMKDAAAKRNRKESSSDDSPGNPHQQSPNG